MSILDRFKDDQEPEKKPEAPPAQQAPAPPAAKAGVRVGAKGAAPAQAQPSLLKKKPAPAQAPPPAAAPSATAPGETHEEEAEGVYDPLTLEEPRTIEDLGVRRDFLMPHVLKTVFVLDTFTGSEAADRLCLPMKLTSDLLEEWKDLKSIEILSASGYQAASRRYGLTTEGRRRAREYMRLSGYIGPVPVPLDSYRAMVKRQTVLEVKVNSEGLKWPSPTSSSATSSSNRWARR